MLNYFKIMCCVLLCLLLVGCTEDFSAYNHARQMLSITSVEDFDIHKDYLLSNTEDSLKDIVVNTFRQTINDPKYKKTLHNVYCEEGSTTKLIFEYLYEGSLSRGIQISYFEYKDNLLVDFSVERRIYESYF